MSNNLRVCQACLSKERQLYSIQKLQDLLVNVDFVDFNLDYDGSLCWECNRVIVKFSSFRKQVELAQIFLREAGKLQDFKSLSTLSCTVTSVYSYSPTHQDPLDSEIYIQPKEIKEEIDDIKENADQSDYDDRLPLGTEDLKDDDDSNQKLAFDKNYTHTEIKQDILKTKDNKITTKRKKKTRDKDKGVDSNDLKEKFVEVQFTEEEMIKNREEKRSHPNFKKLPYNCDTCVLGFTRKENYDLHVEKKHNESLGSHICPVCEIRFTSPAALSKHVKKHYHCYRCKLCVYETTELWSALSHCRTKHREDSEECIHCRQCSYVAKSREELAEHAKTQHSIICKVCGEKFKGQNTLKTHLRRIHGSVREHPCPLCPRAFCSRGRLEAHVTSHGAQSAARLAYCVTCRVQYKNIYVYRNHLATSANHSERRYHCEECGKKFASKVYYKRHYTFYHQKKSPFKCEQCNRLFISDWRLRNHKQMRHGMPRARNHACDECGKKFYTGSTLKAHQLTHSSQRSFMCAVCGDTFKQRPALYTHTRLVHRQLVKQTH